MDQRVGKKFAEQYYDALKGSAENLINFYDSAAEKVLNDNGTESLFIGLPQIQESIQHLAPSTFDLQSLSTRTFQELILLHCSGEKDPQTPKAQQFSHFILLKQVVESKKVYCVVRETLHLTHHHATISSSASSASSRSSAPSSAPRSHPQASASRFIFMRTGRGAPEPSLDAMKLALSAAFAVPEAALPVISFDFIHAGVIIELETEEAAAALTAKAQLVVSGAEHPLEPCRSKPRSKRRLYLREPPAKPNPPPTAAAKPAPPAVRSRVFAAPEQFVFLRSTPGQPEYTAEQITTALSAVLGPALRDHPIVAVKFLRVGVIVELRTSDVGRALLSKGKCVVAGTERAIEPSRSPFLPGRIEVLHPLTPSAPPESAAASAFYATPPPMPLPPALAAAAAALYSFDPSALPIPLVPRKIHKRGRGHDQRRREAALAAAGRAPPAASAAAAPSGAAPSAGAAAAVPRPRRPRGGRREAEKEARRAEKEGLPSPFTYTPHS
jgi:hypothetical protein